MSRELHVPELPLPRNYQRPLIAGWLSLIMHLTLLIASVLLLRVAPRLNVSESDRPVSIVLARTTSTQETQYFDEPLATSAAVNSSATAASTSSPDSSSEANGLPSEVVPLPATSKIALPGALAPVIDGIELAVANATSGGPGKTMLDPTAGREEILAAEARRPKSKGPEGPQGEVGIFGGGTTRGHSFVFLIDRSQSMGSDGLGAIAVAEVELLAALEKLEANHQFQIVAYNQSPTYFHNRKLIPVDDDSRHAAREFLHTLVAFGATDHERAMMSALQLRPDVVYLLTDGDPVINASQRRRIHDETAGRTTISCIQFGRIRPDEQATRTALEALARDNRGSYVFIDMSKR